MRPRERQIRFAQPRPPLPGARKMSGETVLHEHLWDRSPFVCPVRGRREHEEQIVAGTRAVYPASGRDGRVKPYSCLVVIQLESSGAGSAGYTERTSDLGCQCLHLFYVAHGPPFIAQGVTDRCQRKRKGKNVKGVVVVTVLLQCANSGRHLL